MYASLLGSKGELDEMAFLRASSYNHFRLLTPVAQTEETSLEILWQGLRHIRNRLVKLGVRPNN
jgi:hypothetical protein